MAITSIVPTAIATATANLKIFIDPALPPAFHTLYADHVAQHNAKLVATAPYSDAGFDLLVPEDFTFFAADGIQSKYVGMGIKTEMCMGSEGAPAGYYLYPRSSISKTPLMLANHTGIIDASYRGWVIGAFRNLSMSPTNSYTIAKHTRLLQIVHPTMAPIHVTIVTKESDLSITTRGEGGFGSTGR
jgi:dUTP pyrophosphatase